MVSSITRLAIYTSNIIKAILSLLQVQNYFPHILNPENEVLMVVVLEDVGEGLKQDRAVERLRAILHVWL